MKTLTFELVEWHILNAAHSMKDATHKEVTATGTHLYKVDGDNVYREGCFCNWVFLDIKCSSADFVSRIQKIDEPDVVYRTAGQFHIGSRWYGVIEK